MVYLFYLAMAAVIGGHLFFAYGQAFRWCDLCKKLTILTSDEIRKTAFLGKSFASYNASISVGLGLSFLLDGAVQTIVQGVVLIAIIATAAVGAKSTEGNTILIARLMPAAVALLLLLILQF